MAVAISGIGLAAGVQSALAVEINDKISIYGYGHQAYLRTSENAYLEADKKGDWGYGVLALVIAATLDDKTKVWMHLHNTAEKTRMDWAYVDRQVSAGLSLRAGQIKMPVGLYNEIRDIKFLQLSTLIPALYQEATRITDEAYRGIGLNYNHDILRWRKKKMKMILRSILTMGVGVMMALPVWAGDVVGIVNKGNANAVDKAFVVKVYTGEAKAWADGGPVFAVDQGESNPVRADFYGNILGKSAANMKALWAQNIFAGKALPPKVVDQDAEVKKVVSANKNAIGYISASSVDDTVKAAVK
ncbi:MAG: hypothetical protein IDH49_06530 [Gammaproteobacteria bacterium]|nr:hypothetical protein [Gammaproteobacteria bacterium]